MEKNKVRKEDCETGGQFHFGGKTVPETFKEHQLHKRPDSNSMQWTLLELSIFCVHS